MPQASSFNLTDSQGFPIVSQTALGNVVESDSLAMPDGFPSTMGRWDPPVQSMKSQLTWRRRSHVLPVHRSPAHRVRYVCNGCGKSEESYGPPVSFARCSCCKAVFYCNNKSCQVMDWKVCGIATRKIPHSECCAMFAQDKKEFETDTNGARVRTQVFPWANNHHCITGAFFLEEFLAYRGLSGMGFWIQPKEDLYNGQLLLQDQIPPLEKGWVSLSSDEIPSGEALSTNLVYSWSQYAKARNLSENSIAPLLFTDVLTIYQMIIHEFELHRRRPANGEFCVIYVLGAEKELNYLPVLEELAWLLPKGMDLELSFVSPAVKRLVKMAGPSHPKSHLMTCGEYVTDKTAPGGGRVRVALKGRHALFHNIKLSTLPDAVVGLNAGITEYPEWPKTIMTLLEREIPFSFSDSTKHSLRGVRDKAIPSWVRNFNATFERSVNAPKHLDIRLNPFHGIVGRDDTTLMIPTISNGYLLTWKSHLPSLLPKPR